MEKSRSSPTYGREDLIKLLEDGCSERIQTFLDINNFEFTEFEDSDIGVRVGSRLGSPVYAKMPKDKSFLLSYLSEFKNIGFKKMRPCDMEKSVLLSPLFVIAYRQGYFRFYSRQMQAFIQCLLVLGDLRQTFIDFGDGEALSHVKGILSALDFWKLEVTGGAQLKEMGGAEHEDKEKKPTPLAHQCSDIMNLIGDIEKGS